MMLLGRPVRRENAGNERVLVLMFEPRIVIEEEERLLREKNKVDRALSPKQMNVTRIESMKRSRTTCMRRSRRGPALTKPWSFSPSWKPPTGASAKAAPKAARL